MHWAQTRDVPPGHVAQYPRGGGCWGHSGRLRAAPKTSLLLLCPNGREGSSLVRPQGLESCSPGEGAAPPPATRGHYGQPCQEGPGSLVPEPGGASRAAAPETAEALRPPLKATPSPELHAHPSLMQPYPGLPTPFSPRPPAEEKAEPSALLHEASPSPPASILLAVGLTAVLPAVVAAGSPCVSCSGCCSCHHVPLPTGIGATERPGSQGWTGVTRVWLQHVC